VTSKSVFLLFESVDASLMTLDNLHFDGYAGMASGQVGRFHFE
jgi:hypothetical protein